MHRVVVSSENGKNCGVLWRKTAHRKQLVLPEKQHQVTALKKLHNQMGHQGTDRTISLIRDRFFWPYMQREIEQYVMSCNCLKQKKPSRETRAPLTNIVADKIFNDYALKFGFPTRNHHDQGGEFENQLFSQLSKYCSVAGSRTSPYHPPGNGQVERFNRTLIQMLKTLTDKDKMNWKDSLNKLIFAYNCTRTEVTGFSLFYLLYGRSPRLPIDMLFSLPTEDGSCSRRDYVEIWKQGMQEAYAIARENAHKSAQWNKRMYDTKVRSSVLYPGDRVLIRNMTPRGGTGKLRNHWEDTIHTVVRQVGGDVPIYELRPEQGKGKTRILHRNLLLPCDHLPLEVEAHPPVKPKRKTAVAEKVREDSEEEDDDYCVPPQIFAHPPESVRETPVMAADVIQPDLNEREG